ncbi:plasmid pRiA4b ORF-3 family protein [Lutimaribacter sp. EGI FJ00015]|uniref:Plasmid pRiA4b ORF-3 family protein n=1 Tax=Lutimaribacter degradans TaxID=2945989 RepID=A0ACC6A028_9RHOB|nr:plasmid pRiA4b ORF-3 family protein [Lutimaribacter sp. EGI FJ00013]MCM2563803.1 plasmid pRiA4b ORF-3 family protein [Lutimaribacter sp. EGI FJ00013]MCO0614990.1 plasmid pRiA4b ORF-3 family protein [Lutimaribacter sp. EGI FJ00015]MCO0637620.1 plasmid pRiA4b ORF-3 family protein [Lutimaribacter sp. EGI FJ00014]
MSEPVARLLIELKDITPRIWRRVDVRLTTNLRALHDLIQTVMPWESYHLYEFAVGDRIYGEPDPEDAFWDRKVYQAKSLRLSMLINRGITEFLYTYDFGDDWRHRIVIEGVSDAESGLDYPIFLGGERRAPPEDVGGPSGFMEFVEAISKRSHPQHKDMVCWYGGPFHPTDFDEADIAQRVREIAARRKAAYEAFQRSRAMRQP